MEYPYWRNLLLLDLSHILPLGLNGAVTITMGACLSWQELNEIAGGEKGVAGPIAEHLRVCPLCRRRLEQLTALVQAASAIERPAIAVPDEVKKTVERTDRVRGLSCRAARRLMDEYIYGELPPALTSRLEVHLFTCPECYRQYRSLLELIYAARDSRPAQPPEELRQRIHAAVQRAAMPRARRAWAWQAAWAAAAVAVIVLAIWAAMCYGPDRTGQEVTSTTVPQVEVAVRPPEVASAPVTPPAQKASQHIASKPTKSAPSRPARSARPRVRKRSVPAPRTKAAEVRMATAAIAVARPQPPLEEVDQPATPVPAAVALPESEHSVPAPSLPAPATTPSPAEALASPATKPVQPGTKATASAESPRPTPPSISEPAAAEVRIARADTEETLHWLPVQDTASRRVIRVAAKLDASRLEAIVRELNQRAADEAGAAAEGWIPIK